MDIRLKRAYESPARADGLRILVDRLWPRGVAKADAGIDHWLKGLSPSTELRKWFGHDPEKWPEFQKRYFEELNSEKAAEDLELFRKLLRDNDCITLVFAAKDTKHNNAAALRELFLADRL